jgi:hypothetical protein
MPEDIKKTEEERKSTIEAGRRYKSSARFQMSLIVIFSIFLLWVFYKPVASFNFDDEPPFIDSLTPEKIIELGGSPTIARVGMYIRDIPKFDFIDGNLTADLTVWFSFDPRLVSLEKIGKFEFDRAKIIYKSEPYTRIEGGKLFVRYDMTVVFSMQFDYKNFPFDDHRLYFILTNYFVSPDEVLFEASREDIILNREIKTLGWKCVDKDEKSGYIEDELSLGGRESSVLYSRIIFSLDFARVGFRHIISIIVPLILILMVCILTFTFNPYGRYAGNIVPISAAGITAVIAHHFVIDRMSPETGYFMISNHLFLLTILGCCIVLMVNIFGKRIKGIYKDLVALSLYLMLAIAFLILINPFS